MNLAIQTAITEAARHPDKYREACSDFRIDIPVSVLGVVCADDIPDSCRLVFDGPDVVLVAPDWIVNQRRADAKAKGTWE